MRIPLGYWAVDLLDYEPYVSGQYPYLIQAVQWASEMNFTVLIDIHGAPGSQNGWEETGLVGPIAFPANQSNSDRTLNVLRNLTEEFTKSDYNGAVTNIELMNEPIFALAQLRQFYTAGANVVGAANSSGINVTIHGMSRLLLLADDFPLTTARCILQSSELDQLQPIQRQCSITCRILDS